VDEQSALKAAVAGGHARLVEILLQEGADPNSVGHEKRAALTIAVELGNVQITKLLLDKGAGINVLTSATDWNENGLLLHNRRSGKIRDGGASH